MFVTSVLDYEPQSRFKLQRSSLEHNHVHRYNNCSLVHWFQSSQKWNVPFVGCTEVMFITTVFGALVRLRLSPFWKTYCIFNNYIFLSSKFCFRSQLLCSGRFQIITEYMQHKNSRSEKIELDMTTDTTDSVGNTSDIAFSLHRSQIYPLILKF